MKNSHLVLFPKLPFNEQILIWSARKWFQFNGQGNSLFNTLRDAFRLARAPNAYLSLDAFLTILSSSSFETMEFNPPEAVNVTNDELCFSSLIATLQLDEDEGDAAEEEDDGEPFDDKMKRLTSLLKEQQEEGAKLDHQIAENLKKIG